MVAQWIESVGDRAGKEDAGVSRTVHGLAEGMAVSE
jgi:hypothetical protein